MAIGWLMAHTERISIFTEVKRKGGIYRCRWRRQAMAAITRRVSGASGAPGQCYWLAVNTMGMDTRPVLVLSCTSI